MPELLSKFSYNLLTFILAVVLAPWLYLKPRTRFNLLQRYGVWKLQEKNLIWFHVASLGEFNGIKTLLTEFKQKFPQQKILLTVSSDTAYQAAQSFVDYVRILPLDCKLFIDLALSKLKPKLFVVSENELWPGLFWELTARNVPIIQINAKISKTSFERYKRFEFIFSRIMNLSKLIFVADKISYQRFLQLKLDNDKLILNGNTKYDRKFSAPQALSKSDLFQSDLPIFILGSLRPEEELFWFPLINQLTNLNFIVAPRHLEKLELFESQLKTFDIAYVKRSQNVVAARVLLLDSMGELEHLYQLADFSFIGGTLIDLGGHSPIEALNAANVVFLGKYYAKIQDLMQPAIDQGFAFLLTDRQFVVDKINLLLKDSILLNQLKACSFNYAQEQRGANLKIMEILSKYV